MAKWKNLAAGARVVVKDNAVCDGEEGYRGLRGIVLQREPQTYQGSLGIYVQFGEEAGDLGLDRRWWMDYNDVRLANKV